MPHRPLSVLAHVELLTPELDESVAFARDMLGLARRRRGGRLRLPALLGRRLRLQPRPHRRATSPASATAPGARGTPSSSTRPSPRSRRRGRPASGSSRRSAMAAPTASPAREGRRTSCSGTSTARSRPPARSPRSRTGRSGPSSHGIGVRILDHLTVTRPTSRPRCTGTATCSDFRLMAAVEGEPGAPWFFGVATTNEKSHDFGFILDSDGDARAAAPRRVLGRDEPRPDPGRDVPRRARRTTSTSGPASTASASRTTSTSATRSACATS